MWLFSVKCEPDFPQHVLSDHQISTQTCYECDQTFNFDIESVHLATVHESILDQECYCGVCKKIISTESDLERPIETEHQIICFHSSDTVVLNTKLFWSKIILPGLWEKVSHLKWFGMVFNISENFIFFSFTLSKYSL